MWKPVSPPGYEDLYEVSDAGEVRRRGKTTPLRPVPTTGEGYLMVCLARGGGRHVSVRVAALLLEAYRGPRPSRRHVVHHINDDLRDCRLVNLEWSTERRPQPRRPLKERFWAKVKVVDHDACWLWQGGCTVFGYGQIFSGDPAGPRMLLAHRISWEEANGSIPHDLHVLHKCDVPACVNPTHLFLGTPKDNAVDMIRKGRENYMPCRGEANGNAKLSETLVRQIRRRYYPRRVTRRQLAAEFDVSIVLVDKILSGTAWRHLRLGPVPARRDKRPQLITVGGTSLTVAGWARRNGFDSTTIRNRLYAGWPPADAVTIPPVPSRRPRTK